MRGVATRFAVQWDNNADFLVKSLPLEEVCECPGQSSDEP